MYHFSRPRRRELSLIPKPPITERFEEWAKLPPALGTWIAFKYQPTGVIRVGKTCRQGCCINSSGSNLIIAKYWRFATQAEIDAAELENTKYPLLSSEDLWDLFI
jgi:hypothetical protein